MFVDDTSCEGRTWAEACISGCGSGNCEGVAAGVCVQDALPPTPEYCDVPDVILTLPRNEGSRVGLLEDVDIGVETNGSNVPYCGSVPQVR